MAVGFVVLTREPKRTPRLERASSGASSNLVYCQDDAACFRSQTSHWRYLRTGSHLLPGRVLRCRLPPSTDELSRESQRTGAAGGTVRVHGADSIQEALRKGVLRQKSVRRHVVML